MYLHGDQINLGQLIEKTKALLPELDDDASVLFDFGGFVPTKLSSYRGDYSNLALNYGPSDFPGMPIQDFLKMLESSLGTIRTGYKGGDYEVMHGRPLWAAADYSESTSTAIVGIRAFGYVAIIDTKYEHF